jgi:exodeoxyribonuclease VII large subunit
MSLRPLPSSATPRPYTVSELLAEVATTLKTTWRDLSVVGEIGKFDRHGGHGYFSLKDKTSCLNAVIFASDLARVPFQVKPGLEVVVRGSLDLYAPQGKFQIRAHAIEPVGAGALQLAFEQLKARLAAEGLFDPARKRRLPLLARRIAIVTSPTGAAIRDILQVVHRRFANVAITIFPARVQGLGAASEIAAGIDAFSRRGGFDVLILARGGGSL